MDKRGILILGADDGDWEALYINGVKTIEGHSLHWSHVLDALEIGYKTREVKVDGWRPDDAFPQHLYPSDCPCGCGEREDE